MTNVSTKKRIGLVGYFGWGNFGDELFLKVHREQLERDYELSVVHDLLTAPYFSRPIADVVREYDAFIIGGGDLINPKQISNLYWLKEYLSKPVFIYGVGVPASGYAKKEVVEQYRSFFQHPNCKMTIARDPESAQWISKNLEPLGPVEWYPDAVCAMRRPPAQPSETKTLGVVMRGHRTLDPDLSKVRTMIDHAKTLDYRIKHIVLANLELGQVDLQVAQSLAQPDEEICVPESLDDMCVAISSCSALATIKFHGMVVATMYGIPSIAMSVTPKNRNFLKMIARPEMLGGYTQADTYKKLSYYPAEIHPWVRAKLYRDAVRGYERLKSGLQLALAPEAAAA